MRFLLIFLLIIAVSCRPKETQENTLATAEIKVTDSIALQSFDYAYDTYYFDSLPRSINPDGHYKYWAYIGGNPMNFKYNGKLPIVAEKGDTLLRDKIIAPKGMGFFKRGQFTMRSDMIAVVEHDSLSFITTNAGFRDFLGTIDNVDEAVLLAMTFNYYPDYENNGNDYRVLNSSYIMNLSKVDPFPSCIPTINPDAYKTVTVTKDGFIKVVSRQKHDEATKAR